MAPWDGEQVSKVLRDRWEWYLADCERHEKKIDEAKKAGRITTTYEMDYDEAQAKAFVYGDVAGTFRDRDALVRQLESLNPPAMGSVEVFDHGRFVDAFVAERDQLLKQYRGE